MTWNSRSEVARVVVHLDELLAARSMTAAELARRIDLTPVNLSILRTGMSRAIRFSTLAAICEVLRCQPADLLTVEPGDPEPPGPERRPLRLVPAATLDWRYPAPRATPAEGTCPWRGCGAGGSG